MSTRNDRIDGPMAAEFLLGVNCIADILSQHIGNTPVSVKLSEDKTHKQKQILGMARVLMMMYPFAAELALKALWRKLHDSDGHPSGHDLKALFEELSGDATDENDAKRAQNNARHFWTKRRTENNPQTLDAFLDMQSKDFVDLRYSDYSAMGGKRTEDYKLFVAAILAELAIRDPDTLKSVIVQ